MLNAEKYKNAVIQTEGFLDCLKGEKLFLAIKCNVKVAIFMTII